MKIENHECITIGELKEFLLDFPNHNRDGEPFEVWIDNGDGTSSPCVRAIKCNAFDIILERR